MSATRSFFLPTGLLWAEAAKRNAACSLVYAGSSKPMARFVGELRRMHCVGKAASHELYVSGHRGEVARLLSRDGVISMADIDFAIQAARTALVLTDAQRKAYVRIHPNRPVPSQLYFWRVPQDIHVLSGATLVEC